MPAYTGPKVQCFNTAGTLLVFSDTGNAGIIEYEDLPGHRAPTVTVSRTTTPVPRTNNL